MKRIVFIIALFGGLFMTVSAKTTYIAFYHSAIYFTKGETIDSVTSQTPELSYDLWDGKATVTILQDLMDKNRVKSIKRAKAAAGWSAFTSLASGVVAQIARNPYTYYNEMETAKISGYVSNNSYQQADELQLLPISLLVENNSDKEISISDTQLGLVYYVRAHSAFTIPLSTPITTEFRIAFTYSEQPQPEYFSISASNESRKWEADWEDDEMVCVHKYIGNDFNKPLYFIQSKDTYEFSPLSAEDQEALTKEHKDRIAAFEKEQKDK